jgi:hypothetical protein
MNRRTTLLAVVGAVLLVALSWVLLYQPKNQEVAEIQAETVAAEAQAAELETRVAELQLVRETAPEAEAQLVAALTVVPQDRALPSALRQLQLAAEDSGVTLTAMAPGRPEPVTIEGAAEGLMRLNLVVDIEGEYFQMVDFLRRMEDPRISPRGLLWNGGLVDSDYDDYPLLTASLQGDLFAIMPVAPPETETPPVDGAAPQEGEAATEGDDGEEPTDDASDPDAEADPADTVEVE